jgi:type I restriction enzyme, S subunit
MNALKSKIQDLIDLDKSTWNVVRFGDIAEHITEKAQPTPEDSERYIGLEHLDSGSIHIRRWGTPIRLKGEKLRMKNGDIIFGKRNAYLKRAAVAPFDGICSAHAMVLRAKPDVIDLSFFPFFLNSNYFMSRAIAISVGSLSPTINWKTLAKEEFKIPPMEMQKKLAMLLWTVDETEECALGALEATSEYKTSYLENNFLDRNGKRIILGQIGEFVRGVGYKPDDLGLDDEDHVPVLRANNLQHSRIVFDDLKFVHKKNIHEIQYLRNGDIVICMSNGSKDLVGKTAVFSTNEKEFSFGSFCGCFRATDEKYSDIAKYLFQTKSYRSQIKYLLTGSTINNLKPSDIESMSFSISEKNIEKAEKDLQKIEKLENSQQNYLSGIRSLKQSLINSIF